MWGKRAKWNELSGMWGKRAWNDMSGGWGKSEYTSRNSMMITTQSVSQYAPIRPFNRRSLVWTLFKLFFSILPFPMIVQRSDRRDHTGTNCAECGASEACRCLKHHRPNSSISYTSRTVNKWSECYSCSFSPSKIIPSQHRPHRTLNKRFYLCSFQ